MRGVGENRKKHERFDKCISENCRGRETREREKSVGVGIDREGDISF